MSKFTYDLEVPYFACDKGGNMTPSYILDYLGEASSSHSDSLGLGFKDLSQMKYGWVLNRWKIQFLNYPRVKDKIKVQTWTSRVDKFYANREFVIYNDKMQEMVRASTLWIFLNTKKQRPIRIPKEIEDRYNMLEERIFEDFYKFTDLDLGDYSREYFTRRSDIDYNNHVNNVRYLDWILETVDHKIYDNYLLSELEIQYKKEVLYGDSIVSSIRREDSTEEEINFLHQINVKASEGVNTHAKTIWKTRD